MRKCFVAEVEDQPGEAWLDRFIVGREEAERWYLSGNREYARPAECRAALHAHMPELVPLYDRACQLVGDDQLAHRILSHYRPPPQRFGCSQAVWLGEDGPALVRNFDWPLDIVSERIEMTSWFGRKIIAKAQRPWGGCLDGMNEAGLAASLTYGGDKTEGRGFSVILILRYVLEICSQVAEAVEVLRSIPVALSQNVTLLDKTGAYATLFLGPGRDVVISSLKACTNHQELALSTDSRKRQDVLLSALQEPSMTLPALAAHFLKSPVYSRAAKFPTAYTAIYRPCEGKADYVWPGKVWPQRFDQFNAGHYVHDYGAFEA